MVAAWMRADTGVGPAIASGSQRYNGNCADLPTAPRKNSAAMADAVVGDRSLPSTLSNTSRYVTLPSAWNVRKMAIMKPKSPMRFVMKAFLPADALASLSNQNEISKYEQ